MKKVLSSLLLVSLLAACGGGDTTPKTGSATEKGYGGDVTVTVTVEGDKVTEVTYEADKETNGIGSVAAEKLAAAMVEAGTTEVDGIAGATYTSEAFIKAAKAAVEAAE